SIFFFPYYTPNLDLLSFPTRRSSDLSADRLSIHQLLLGTEAQEEEPGRSGPGTVGDEREARHPAPGAGDIGGRGGGCGVRLGLRDRKSTRLNSSHDQISYAVFCLKKK